MQLRQLGAAGQHAAAAGGGRPAHARLQAGLRPAAVAAAQAPRSSGPWPPRSPTVTNGAGEFQPRLLTAQLQKAKQIAQLEVLWQQHAGQFNSIHFSALMQQLVVLHSMAGAPVQQRARGGSSGGSVEGGVHFSAFTLPPDGLGAQQQGGSGSGSDASSQQQAQDPAQPTSGAAPNQQAQQQLQAQAQAQQQQQQLQAHAQQQQQQQQALRLARAVASAALQPGTLRQLDGRALVMTAHSLAKLGLAEPQLFGALLQALRPLLGSLDAQQLPNLVWSVAVCCAPPRAGGGASGGPSSSGSSQLAAPAPRCAVPSGWLDEATAALGALLPQCSASGVTMALWGYAQLSHAPPPGWWQQLWAASQGQLAGYSGQELSVVMYACGKLKPQVPEPWLKAWLSASCDVLPRLRPQELTMSLWGVAAAGGSPHKAWLMLWFLVSRATMGAAGAQDLSLWLYSLAVLKLTPSPLWCSSYVEASYDKLTDAATRPQDLVNVMWAVSRMSWSPPLLYWRGLLRAAGAAFSRFNPQDLANCISAAVAVDVGSIEKPWLAAFVAASQPKLCAFQPVQLANTAYALVGIKRAHGSWAPVCVHAGWHAAFTRTAASQLGQGRFSAGNLELVLLGVRELQFSPAGAEVAAFLRQAEAVLPQLRQQEAAATDAAPGTTQQPPPTAEGPQAQARERRRRSSA